MSTPAGFKAWWPDDGEDLEDAIDIVMPTGWLRSDNAHRYAAEQAGEYDHDERGGWERGSDDQTVVVLAIDEDDLPIGDPQTFTVTREVVPRWRAQREVEPSGATPGEGEGGGRG